MAQTYVVDDRPDGRVFDYTHKPSAAPSHDNISHSYAPPDDPDQARGHAFNAAVGAFIGSTFLGLALAGVAVWGATQLGWTWTGTLTAFAGGFFLPFVWPFPKYW